MKFFDAVVHLLFEKKANKLFQVWSLFVTDRGYYDRDSHIITIILLLLVRMKVHTVNGNAIE